MPYKILEKAIKAGTIKNILPYIKRMIDSGIYRFSINEFHLPIKNPEFYTDENIELFGNVENIVAYGEYILKNEEYLKNYKYIKEHYGIMKLSSNMINSEKILSDENVKRIGYNNIFKFFNSRVESAEKLKNMPKDMTKERLDQIIELYGDIPEFKAFYNEKFIKAIQNAKKANQEINFKNEWLSETMLEYIIKNDLLDNIATILNVVDKEQLIYDRDGIPDFRVLKLMNPEIVEVFGGENIGKIANQVGVENVLLAQKRNLLGKWKSKIDSVNGKEKEPFYSLQSFLLLEKENDDLSLEEIKIINRVLSMPVMTEKYKNEIEEMCREHPEYIRLLEIPGMFLEHASLKKDLENIPAKFQEFQEIQEIMGKENFINVIKEREASEVNWIYDKMQQAYKSGTLKIWKELLKVDNRYIPNRLEFLNEGFLVQNSPEDIIRLRERDWEISDELERIMEECPDFITYVYNIDELLEMGINRLYTFGNRIKGENIDEKIISIMRDKEGSKRLKEYVKKVLIDMENIDVSIKELIEKGEKFDKVAHFIPTPKVVMKYPEEQIEKFNKKLWFNLARHKLYSSSDDTKDALIEAILSLGIFENDDTQEERLGMLQKFATYIPKAEITIDEDVYNMEDNKHCIEEHFEIVKKEAKETVYELDMEKLLNDPNILGLFDSIEDAENELWKLKNYYKEEEMQEIFQREYVNEQYRDIMEYIYKFGYNKVEKYLYTIKLKTDIQQLKSKDKKKGQAVENEIRDFYYSFMDNNDFMDPHKLHRIFDGMDMTYKEGFYNFFKNNIDEILKDTEKQLEISKIQRQWEEIVEANLGQKITFEKCELYIYNHSYDNIEDNEREIAKLSSLCGYSQKDFDEIKEIFAEQCKRTQSSIPQIEYKNKSNGYSYKVLRLDDPMAIFVGELTDCCQAKGDNGESCMRHSVISPNGRVLVVQDENGKVLSQSWIWRNKDVLCFDNIEAVQKDSNNKKIVSSEILDMVIHAAKEFVETDKKSLRKWKENKIAELEHKKEIGNITEQQYKAEIDKIEEIVEGQQLTRVTVGVGNTDVDLKGLKKDRENRYPEENVKYISDSRKQMILYEDSEFKSKKTNLKTVAIYSDSEESSKLVNINTSEIENNIDEYYDDEDEYYDDDEYYDEEYDEDEYYDESAPIRFVEEVYQIEENFSEEKNEQGNMITQDDIRKTLGHVVGRSQARQAIENIRKILRNER